MPASIDLATADTDASALARSAAELSGEVEEIARLLVRRGTEALITPS